MREFPVKIPELIQIFIFQFLQMSVHTVLFRMLKQSRERIINPQIEFLSHSIAALNEMSLLLKPDIKEKPNYNDECARYL